jgi:hypothetical protein
MKKKLRIHLSFEIPLDGGARTLTGDEYHTVSKLTEPELERVRGEILDREKTTHAAAITGPCLFRSIVRLSG